MRLFEIIKNLKLGVKLNILAFLIFGLLLLGMVLATDNSLNSFVNQVGSQDVIQNAQTIQKRFGEIEHETLNNSVTLSNTAGLSEAIVARNIQSIQAELLIAATRLGFDDVDTVDSRGRRLFDVNAENSTDEDRLIKLALLGFDATGIIVEEGEGLPEISIAAAVPVYDDSGTKIIGAIIGSRFIDDEMLSRVNIFPGHSLDLGLIYDGRIVASNFADAEDLEYFSAHLLDANSVGQALNGQTIFADELVTNPAGSPHAFGHTPLTVGADTRAVIGLAVNMGDLAVFQGKLISSQGALFALFALTGIVIFAIFASYSITTPIRRLQLAAEQLANGNYTQRVSTTSKDEVGQLANSFNDMASQLGGLIGSLEQRVAERTRNLELAAEVGRTVSQVRSLDVMLKDAAELIRKQFDLYYVQVYLADASQANLILQFGTGSVGEQLISRRHQLPLNTSSVNGRAAVEKKSVVISDTTASATFKPNPILPDTRSEMAVPLMIGDKVVGVLDMQSEKADSLNQEILPAFEALAGQLAIAIQNANLLAEAEQARAEVETQARRLSRSNWIEYLDAIHKPEETGFVFEHNKIAPLMQEQAEGENVTAAPITVTGETLGKLVVEMEGRSSIANTEELVNTVARQVAQHIENLRLLDSAERYRAEAEQASRRLTHEGWQEYMVDNAAKGLGYIYDLNEVRPFKQDEEKQAEESGISLPLKVRDEAVGRIIVKGVEGEEAADLVNAVAERLGAHIEGLRLSMQTEQALATTKKQAQREQALRQITSAVRGSNDPAIILRTAARELGNILGRQTVVKLATAGEAKAAQADHPAEIAGETVANNGNESVSSADRS